MASSMTLSCPLPSGVHIEIGERQVAKWPHDLPNVDTSALMLGYRQFAGFLASPLEWPVDRFGGGSQGFRAFYITRMSVS